MCGEIWEEEAGAFLLARLALLAVALLPCVGILPFLASFLLLPAPPAAAAAAAAAAALAHV